jgi:chromosome segregation ATPase
MKKLCIALALLYAPFAHAAFKCVDERGVTLFGDTPPAGCANVVMYELSPHGAVIRKIDPTPTPEQLKARLEEQAKRKEAERAAAEQKRKDMALLATYASEKEIDVARDRNIEPIRSRIRGAEERITAVDKRLEQLANEMEFYKAGKKGGRNEKARPPESLVADQERAQKERATLAKNISDSEKEIQAVRARYEADRRRYAELKGGGGDSALRPAAEQIAPR